MPTNKEMRDLEKWVVEGKKLIGCCPPDSEHVSTSNKTKFNRKLNREEEIENPQPGGCWHPTRNPCLCECHR